MRKVLSIFLKNSLVLLAIFFLIFITAIYSQPSMGNLKNERELYFPPDSVTPDTSKHFYKETLIDSIIELGKTFLGLHYHYGGRTPAGFDCSGYVSYLFGKFGYSLPPSSSGMGYVGEVVPFKEARKGDLILFQGRSTRTKRIGHVALIIGVDSLGVTMMHSDYRGITIDRYPEMPYYRARFVEVRRVKL
jgi:cell wall-associated NlpC family hydrolase